MKKQNQRKKEWGIIIMLKLYLVANWPCLSAYLAASCPLGLTSDTLCFVVLVLFGVFFMQLVVK